VALDAITQREVRAWVTSLTVRGLAPATVHKAYQLFAKTMVAAVDGGMLAQTPCRGVALPKVEHEEMRYLNPAEIACLAEVIRPGYQALVFVGAYGGLRIGELAGLRRSRVDLDAGNVDVAETVVEVEGRLLFGRPRPAPAAAGSGSRAGWSTSWPCTCEHRAARPIRCSAHRPADRCG
jgi:site-specific recombinase XerC